MNDMPRRMLPPGLEPMEPPTRSRPRPSGAFGVLDIGTTKIVCIIGRVESDGSLRVLGFGWQKGRGVRAGGISDIEEAERAIRAAVGQAEEMAEDAAARGDGEPLLRPAGEPAVQRAVAGGRARGDRAGHPPRAA